MTLTLRLRLVLLVMVLWTAACANRGFDGEPEGAEGDAETARSADAGDDADTAAGADDGSGAEGDGGGAQDGDDAALPAGAVADPAALASIETTECAFDERVPLPRQPVCYSVSVPEDWSDPDPDDRVILPVAVFAGDGDTGGGAGEDAAGGAATIFLDGGPGVATLDLLWSSFIPIHQPLIGLRDHIVFDQRGVGLAEPNLSCPELIEVERAQLAGELAPDTEDAAALDAVDTCRERLEGAGADLAAYNSVASANDVEAIRALLGYDQLDLLGVSYGTRLAQTHLRMYPESVRSVVLDSIVPVEIDLWTNLAAEAKGAFEQLFEGCEADPACAEAYPDLEARFFAMLDRLDAEPLEVELTDLIQGTTMPAVVDGDQMMSLVFSALYNRTSFAVVPAMVDEVEAGDTTTVEFLGSVEVTNFPYAALGQRLSVECNEEIAFEDEADITALAPTEPGYARLGDLDGEATLFDLCRLWPAGEAPAEEGQPVASDVPALLLAGRYDPITRPHNADLVAAHLPNSYSFVLPNEGHGIVSSACGSELVVAFLTDPTVEPDDSCIATSPAPAWVPGGGGAEVAMVDFSIETPFQVSGVRPADWIEAGNGAFARQLTALDPTALIIQPTGGVVPGFLAELLGEQLEVTLAEAGPIEAGERQWQTFRSDEADQVVRLAVSSGSDGVMVVLVTTPEEVDSLESSVFVPAVEAAVAS